MSIVTFFRVAGDVNANASANVERRCIHCGNEVIFLMTKEQYNKWIVENNYVQDVFPHVDKEVREWMISGTHPQCWNEMFPPEEDDEEYYS